MQNNNNKNMNNNSTATHWISSTITDFPLYSEIKWINEKYNYDNPVKLEEFLPEKELSKCKIPSSFVTQDWVDEWRETMRRAPTIPWDDECMFGWFCNAIMCGFDEASRREQAREKFVYILRSSQHSGVIATYIEQPSKEVCDRDYSLYLGKDLECIAGTDIPVAGQGSDWNCVLEKWKLNSTNRVHEIVKIEYK